VSSPDELAAAAVGVRADLALDDALAALGEPHLVGSVALGLMVWPDLDITVICDALDVPSLYAILDVTRAWVERPEYGDVPSPVPVPIVDPRNWSVPVAELRTVLLARFPPKPELNDTAFALQHYYDMATICAFATRRLPKEQSSQMLGRLTRVTNLPETFVIDKIDPWNSLYT
jgi:hypothetical protein